eukprot:5087734-Prymnesium_polylepis.1
MSGKNLKMLNGYNPQSNNKIPDKLVNVYKTTTLDPLTRYNTMAFGFADVCLGDWARDTRI